MGVGEAHAPKIGHRVAFYPHHVIQDPIAQFLQAVANGKYIVITAYHPQGAGRFKHSLALSQPLAGKALVGRQTLKFIPVLIHRVHLAHIGAPEFVLQLQVIGRVREDQVYGGGRQLRQNIQAAALDDAVQVFIEALRHAPIVIEGDSALQGLVRLSLLEGLRRLTDVR